MLMVREEQIDALLVGKVEAFKIRLTKDLQEKFNPIASTLETYQRIEKLIEQGVKYGLEQAADLRYFCYLCVGLEERWDYLWGWMESIFLDPELDGQTKLEIVFENLAGGPRYHPFLETVGLR